MALVPVEDQPKLAHSRGIRSRQMIGANGWRGGECRQFVVGKTHAFGQDDNQAVFREIDSPVRSSWA